jgi:Ca2+-transporting ATPase
MQMMTTQQMRPDAPALSGLSEQQARSRLAQDGPNELQAAQRRSVGRRVLALLAEPMFALLLAAVLIYLALGDRLEGLTLAVFVLAVLGMTLFQEGRADRAIEALRQLSAQRVQVLRGGIRREIPAHEVVCADLLCLAEGNRIAADGVLLQAQHLQVDESLLTGESLPVAKHASAAVQADPGARVFAGTFVVAGQGLMQVSATGPHTEIGQIGQALHTLVPAPTALQRQTARLVRTLAIIAMLLCAVMVAIEGWRTGLWLPALLGGIAVAMAMLPEEYPVVLAIFPALGARRLAQQGVLTRRINCIETLGATTVLCVDKTGTLTQNRMAVHALAVVDDGQPLILRVPTDGLWSPDALQPQRASEFARIAEHAILASAQQPFDPMEQAFHRLGRELLAGTDRLHDWDLVHTYPLSTQLRAMSHIWRAGDAGHVISAKGAPEAVMELCHLPEPMRVQWQQAVQTLAADGLRVLAVAQGAVGRHQDGQWPACAHDFDFEWIGLIGLADPLRPQVPEAMAQCRRAGIRVMMITGDHPVTAQAIARQAGLDAAQLLTADEIEGLSDEALTVRLRHSSVCARILPQQKLRIVQALARDGQIVTMTGDGVNDAPALRAAHVGVAMGQRGTDVAREAASMVLVDDDFASIVRAIRSGRRIFTNLRKAMVYIFAIHIPIAGMAMLPIVLGLPPLVLPLHIALIELIVDPACSLAFESDAEDADVMEQPPRNTDAPLLGAAQMLQAAGQGLLMLGGAALAYWASSSGLGLPESAERNRAMVLLSFVVANAGLIVVSKARGRLGPVQAINWSAVAVIAAALAVVLLAIYLPWLAAALQLAPLAGLPLAVALACGLPGLLVFGLWRGARLLLGAAASTSHRPGPGAQP